MKPPGAPMYSAGKDGDLRDIWRRITGELPLDKNASSSGSAKILTVFGKEDMTDHSVADIAKEISIIGKHLKDHGAKRVAIYLPNSVEFLVALFAGAFYGFSPILIPYNQPHPTLIDLLNQTGADSLIAEAGSVPLADVSAGVAGLRQVIWTVEKTSRHMDWNEVPEGIGGKIDVSVWHQLIQDQKNASAELPSDDTNADDDPDFYEDKTVSKHGTYESEMQQIHESTVSDEDDPLGEGEEDDANEDDVIVLPPQPLAQ